MSSKLQGNTINSMLGLYFYDMWLWVYNFSMLRKIGVNLAVSNNRVFQIPGIYVTLQPLIIEFYHVTMVSCDVNQATFSLYLVCVKSQPLIPQTITNTIGQSPN